MYSVLVDQDGACRNLHHNGRCLIVPVPGGYFDFAVKPVEYALGFVVLVQFMIGHLKPHLPGQLEGVEQLIIVQCLRHILEQQVFSSGIDLSHT